MALIGKANASGVACIENSIYFVALPPPSSEVVLVTAAFKYVLVSCAME